MAGARADTRAQTTPPPAGLRQLSFYDYHTARTDPTDYSRFPHLGKLSLCRNEGYGRNAVSTHNLPASLTALRLAYSCPRNTFIYNNSNVFDSNREENGTVFLRLSHLTRLVDLELVGLRDPFGSQLSHRALAKLTGLTRLVLGNVGPISVDFLHTSFPRLVHLALDLVTDSIDARYDQLPKNAPMLETLSLSFSSDADGHGLGYGAEFLREEMVSEMVLYPRMHTLLLHCAAINVDGARDIARLPALRSLTLRSCLVSKSCRNILAECNTFTVCYQEEDDACRLCCEEHYSFDGPRAIPNGCQCEAF